MHPTLAHIVHYLYTETQDKGPAGKNPPLPSSRKRPAPVVGRLSLGVIEESRWT